MLELLEGKTLRDWMAKNLDSGIHCAPAPFPIERCVEVALQVAEGMAAAHEKGIIHRDIKPTNIFLTSAGRVKILDFGLAKLQQTELWEDATTHNGTDPPPDRLDPQYTLTRAGLALGTAGYMSPEQVRGERLDPRSDIFSFGLVLYEMTSGRRAFSGDTAAQLHSQILDSSPKPVRELNPRIPIKLERIIERALQKDRAHRYQSAAELGSALDQALRETPRRKTRTRLLISCAATMVPIIAAAVWLGTRGPAPRPSRVFDQRQLTVNSYENPVTGGEISPDGKYLVYTDLDGIHLKQMDSGESQLIKMPLFSGDRAPNWELGPWLPDSTHFMAISELPDEPSSLWKFPIAAGQPRKITEGANPWGVSPEGSWLVITRNHDREVWLIDPSGEHPRKLWESGDDSRMRAFTWSPDGRRIAYIRTHIINGTDEAQIESRLIDSSASVVMLSGKAAREVTQLDEGLRDLNWLPDGRLIFVGGRPDIHESSCNLWSGYVDPQSGMFAAPPQPLTNWAGFCVTTFSRTSDGRKFVFTRSLNTSIVYVSDFDPAHFRLSIPSRLTYTEDLSSPTEWTADSSAVFIRSNREGSWGIYRQPLRAGLAQPIITGLPNVSRTTPVSPDNKWLMYYSNTGEAASPIHVMRVPLEGGPAQEVARGQFSGIACVRAGEKYCIAGEIAPDGKHIVFSEIDPLKGLGRKFAEFADENLSEFAWDVSPDGKLIVLHKGRDAEFRLLRPGTDRAVETISTEGGVHLRMMTWAADGQGLFASAPGEHGAQLVYVDLSGRVRELWGLPGYRVFLAGRSSPDGRHVVIQGTTVASSVWMIQDF